MDRSLAVADERDEVARFDLGARPEDDDGLDRLSPAIVRDADDGGGIDGGVREQDVLDIAGKALKPPEMIKSFLRSMT